MPFSTAERTALLTLKGVGPTVVARFEQMGYDSLAALASADTEELLARGAQLTGSSCWRNSPQARATIAAALNLARQG